MIIGTMCTSEHPQHARPRRSRCAMVQEATTPDRPNHSMERLQHPDEGGRLAWAFQRGRPIFGKRLADRLIELTICIHEFPGD